MMNIERKDRNLTWFSWIDAAEKNDEAKRITDRFVKRPPVEFYDIRKDPWEFNNLANNPTYKKRIEEYTRKLHAWMKQQGDKGVEMDIVYAKK